MDTIFEIIARNAKRSAENRLQKLEELGSVPQVILDTLKAKIENPTKGIGKINEFGHLTPTSFEMKTGKGGKPYVRFYIENQNDICYIMDGKYGPFLYQEVNGA